MRLGIVSDCVHMQRPDGSIVTEVHILLHQLEALSHYFSEVWIACPFVSFNADKVVTAYGKAHIHFIPLPVAGGKSLKHKINLLKQLPAWLKGYKLINKKSDVVYLRLPDNVSVPALFYFSMKQKKMFATYTGTWDDYKGEAFTWRFEKSLLRRVFNGPYWTYTDKPLKGKHMNSGYSPSYSEEIWQQQTSLVNNKKCAFVKGRNRLRFITVGALVPHKNQMQIIEACKILKEKKLLFSLTVVGDGIMKDVYQQKIKEFGLYNEVTLSGRKTREELMLLFQNHDFVVQAPFTEPYGKVPMEGLFFGLLPVLSNVGVSAAFTGNGAHGFLFEPGNVDELANILTSLYSSQHLFPAKIEAGRRYALHNTLERWAEEYYNTVTTFYKLNGKA